MSITLTRRRRRKGSTNMWREIILTDLEVELLDRLAGELDQAGYQAGWRPQLLRGIADRWRHQYGAQIKL